MDDVCLNWVCGCDLCNPTIRKLCSIGLNRILMNLFMSFSFLKLSCEGYIVDVNS